MHGVQVERRDWHVGRGDAARLTGLDARRAAASARSGGGGWACLMPRMRWMRRRWTGALPRAGVDMVPRALPRPERGPARGYLGPGRELRAVEHALLPGLAGLESEDARAGLELPVAPLLGPAGPRHVAPYPASDRPRHGNRGSRLCLLAITMAPRPGCSKVRIPGAERGPPGQAHAALPLVTFMSSTMDRPIPSRARQCTPPAPLRRFQRAWQWREARLHEEPGDLIGLADVRKGLRADPCGSQPRQSGRWAIRGRGFRFHAACAGTSARGYEGRRLRRRQPTPPSRLPPFILRHVCVLCSAYETLAASLL